VSESDKMNSPSCTHCALSVLQRAAYPGQCPLRLQEKFCPNYDRRAPEAGQHPDDIAVDQFAAAMKSYLDAKDKMAKGGLAPHSDYWPETFGQIEKDMRDLVYLPDFRVDSGYIVSDLNEGEGGKYTITVSDSEQQEWPKTILHTKVIDFGVEKQPAELKLPSDLRPSDLQTTQSLNIVVGQEAIDQRDDYINYLQMIANKVDLEAEPHQTYFDRLLERVDQLMRAEPVAVPEGWRPIETAPKDGTRILVRNGDMNIKMFYTEPGDIGVAEWVVDEGWISAFCCDSVTKFSPTEWMPMPAAPKERG